jgi:multiple sugar transport system substrate-binding protein
VPDLASTEALRALTLADDVAGDVDRNSLVAYDWNGATFAQPIDAAAFVLPFRPDLLGSSGPPATWNELVDVARSLHHPPHRYGFCVPWGNATLMLLSLLATADPEVLRRTPHLDPETTIESLRLINTIRRLSVPQEIVGARRPLEVLLDSNLAVFAVGVFAYVPYLVSQPERLAFGPMPVWCDDRRSTMLGGAGLAVVAGGDHESLAVEFADLVMSRAFQRTTYRASGGQPARASAWREPAASRSERDFGERLAPMIEETYTRPLRPGWLIFEEGARAVLDRYLHGPADERQTLEALRHIARASFATGLT